MSVYRTIGPLVFCLAVKKILEGKNAIKFFGSGQIFRVGRGRGNK